MIKKVNSAFTLPEIIVGVSLALVLMISVGVLVSSGIKNITIQRQILNESGEVGNLVQNLNDILSGNYSIIASTSTSILLKTNYVLGNPSYYYIGEKILTGYCLNDSDIKNKYLEFKAFNPLYLTGVVHSGSYIRNEVYSGGNVLIGNGVFGDILIPGMSSTGAYLNNPTGITFNSSSGILFISDSGNNRIIYVSGGLVYKLLDIDDGIFSPTGILYHLSKLYILNSGRNELLVLDSSLSLKPVNLIVVPESDITIDRIDIEVLPSDFAISGTYSTRSYYFSGITKNPGDIVSKSENKLTYSFSGSRSLTGGNSYLISIPTFTGTLRSRTRSYYLKVNLFSGTNPVYENYFPYLTRGDNDLTTLSDNTLRILTGSLDKDFSEIRRFGSSVILYNYIDGKYLMLNGVTGNFISSGSLRPFNVNDFESVDKSEKLMIKDLKIQINQNLLTIKIDYYKNFDCFNEKDSLVKTILIKRAIPN